MTTKIVIVAEPGAFGWFRDRNESGHRVASAGIINGTYETHIYDHHPFKMSRNKRLGMAVIVNTGPKKIQITTTHKDEEDDVETLKPYYSLTIHHYQGDSFVVEEVY